MGRAEARRAGQRGTARRSEKAGIRRFFTWKRVLGTFFTDDQFADLYPADGQPAYAPWRLALVSIMQFAENLTDRQAADAVRSRIDWKYALSLDLTDEGFDFSVLSEFRQRLLEHEAGERLLNLMLEQFVQGQIADGESLSICRRIGRRRGRIRLARAR